MELNQNQEKLKEYRKRAKELVAQMTLEEKVGQTLYQAPAIPRLGIKAYNWWNEALHGVARAGTATVFPQAIGMAATFDEDLLEQVGDAVSTEARASLQKKVLRLRQKRQRLQVSMWLFLPWQTWCGIPDGEEWWNLSERIRILQAGLESVMLWGYRGMMRTI